MEEFIKFLVDDFLYRDVWITDDRYVAIYPFLYTHAIITGRIGDRVGYDDRWCYETYEKAKTALDAWNGTGEPNGWCRHPRSGRRRDDKGNEWINY